MKRLDRETRSLENFLASLAKSNFLVPIEHDRQSFQKPEQGWINSNEN